MTNIAATSRPSSGFTALLRHGRYVIAENRVTGFAFGLFLLIVLAAVFGPYIVPHDPLASDTAAALKPPSMKHWFGTDQIGRDVLSRVVVATRLDFFIAVASVALVFLMGGLAGVAAGFFGGWTDRIVGRIADTIMAFPLFVLAMGIVAALGNTVQNIILATAIVNFPLYARVARAEANVRREAGFVLAARLCGNTDARILLGQVRHRPCGQAKVEAVGIGGDSGAGKSVASYAVMRILDRAGRIARGSVVFSGLDVRAAGESDMRNLRGREISMIFQNPRAALNPI